MVVLGSKCSVGVLERDFRVMTLTPRHFCTFETNPTSAVFRRAESVDAGVNCKIVTGLSLPSGHGLYALQCDLDTSSRNTFKAHDIVGTDDEDQFFITEVSVSFTDVDIQLQTDPHFSFIEFAANGGADIEWRLQIEGGTGVGFDTHRLIFYSSTGGGTVLANDPFTVDTFHTIRVLWKHKTVVNCRFKIDGADPNVVGAASANCLAAGAGNATIGRMNFRGPVGSPGPGEGAPIFSLYVHSEADGSSDLTGPLSFAIKDLRITGKAGTTPDFGFGAGGTATTVRTAEKIYDDALLTDQQIDRHGSGTEWGAAYACNLSDVVGGPSGRFGFDTDIFLYKISVMGRWTNVTDFGRVAIGRAPHDLSSSSLDISTVGITGIFKGWEAVIESADANFPIADNGDWLVIGVGNAGGSGGDVVRWIEGWGWALYDQSSGQNKDGLLIKGQCEILGGCAFVG